MKILVVAHTSFNEIGGAERYSHQLANALATSLGRANVLFWPIGQRVPLTRIDGQAYTLVSPWWYRNRWARRMFHRYLLLSGIDHIIADMLYVGPYAQDLASFLDVPYDVITHGIEVWGNVPAKQMNSLLGARTVFSVSAFTRDRVVEKGVSPKHTRLLPNHVDTGTFYTDSVGAEGVVRRHSLHGQRIMLTVCRMNDKEGYKGYDRVVASLPSILQQAPNAVYLIVGTGPDQPRMERTVAEMGLADRVIFAGRAPDDAALRAYYSACDVFVMPSQTVMSEDVCKGEGFGIAYIEASACGKPVVAGDGGGVPDAVIDGVTGLLVDPTDMEAIAGAIVRLLKDEDLAHRLGQQGLRRVQEELSLSNLQKRVDDYLQDVRSQIAARPRLGWRQAVRRLL